ncbi:trypsin [Ectopseudomonas oleovorans]|uniref:Trypsin n=1 Tax=Ectopseudomonas oleovorans TaxID=301 RepID=A0A397NBG1_ECTOL|nr:trypsin-like serine protease [Pseudomonas oleovorans]RIA31311.1 trypsin [Pseudomonas oleovorans]
MLKVNNELWVCNRLFNKKKEIGTHRYCAPIFIASTFSGTLLIKDEHLAPSKIDENTLRSGTVTFIQYKGGFYALTCRHVIDSLERQEQQWKDEQLQNHDFIPPISGMGLYTPIGNNQYHFNYKFTKVADTNVDLAIARIKPDVFKRLDRSAITLASKKKLPRTGIASGYPEEQRAIKEGNSINTFHPKFVSCIATLQESQSGNLYIQDTISEHRGVDVLSGMSGGPLIWSDSKRFGLAGIIKSGYDIQPKENGFTSENSIFIHAERVTPQLLDNWLESAPPMEELKDETKSLYIPSNMRE